MQNPRHIGKMVSNAFYNIARSKIQLLSLNIWRVGYFINRDVIKQRSAALEDVTNMRFIKKYAARKKEKVS